MDTAAWRAAGLVAATYVYFLIFAEFAFIELARPVTGDGDALRGVMGALAAGGITGSVLGAWLGGWSLRRWFLGCAGAAALAVAAPGAGVIGLGVAAAAVGLALGAATVKLASGLRSMVGNARLGWVAGLGTGAAYAFCNLPWVFEATPQVQAGMAMAAVLAGAWAAGTGRAEEKSERNVEGGGGGMAAWVVVFLALVWMDSAAFYIIQHTEQLKAATWQGPWTLWGNAAVHFAAALAAGWTLDRGRARGVVALAAGLLAAACLILGRAGAEVLYVAGVSCYSAALVYVPARTGRPWVASAVFAVAGWAGSALGIGMAQDLHGVPAWFAVVAVGVIAGGLVWQRRAAGVLLVLVAGGLLPETAKAEEVSVTRGREVYIAEGCIHCHSQYVRPRTVDVERWGPARELEVLLKESPPLPGNRRQGPDLANVGNRRTVEWNRLHLIAPREVSPGSRMPAYAKLFRDGETRGEDLLVYLDSLGKGTEEARAALVAEWRPEAAARVDAALGREWFARACVQCHGPDGRGDGSVAGKLAGRPADLTRAEMDRDEERLARLIKFGRAGTAMAGHETLKDEAVVSLARYVAELQAEGERR
jgi:cytochrome c oxidase cbb3-type subunit 2